MPLIILAKSSDPDGTNKARVRLDALLQDPLTVLALIGGDGSDASAALEIAVARATVKPDIRRVVWIPDKAVLDDAKRADYFPGDTLLVTIGLGDTVADRLSPSRAKIRIFVERAFLSAEEQQP